MQMLFIMKLQKVLCFCSEMKSNFTKHCELRAAYTSVCCKTTTRHNFL